MSDPNEHAAAADAAGTAAATTSNEAAAASNEAAPNDEAQAAADVDNKPPPAELTPDIVHNALRWYATHAADDDALATLVELRGYFTRPEFSVEAVAAASSVTKHVLTNPELPPAVNAQMTLLLSQLLPLEVKRDDVDAIYVAWVRHPSSFGPRPTPHDYQRDGWIQRLGDLLGWGSINVQQDREALARFVAWLDEWSVKNKFRAKRPLDLLRRMFPSDVWKGVHFPPPQGQGHGHAEHGSRGHGHAQGHGGGGNAPTEPKGEGAAAEEGAAAQAPAGASASTAGDAANPAGPRKKRRRKKRRGAGGATPGAPAEAGAAGAGAEADGGESGDGDGDGGDDGPAEAGESNSSS